MQDMATGLVWSPSLSDLLGGSWQTWGYANDYANNLVLDGFDDWRLPTAAELQAAVSHDIANHVKGPGGALWTSNKCGGGRGG